MDSFEIKTKTTGFGSPARAYVEKRLDPNDLLISDPYSTFFFQWEGEEKFDLIFGDYLVVDRSSIPNDEDLDKSDQKILDLFSINIFVR